MADPLLLAERRPAHPLAGVERALLAHDLLGEDQVRQVMRLYLALRDARTQAGGRRGALDPGVRREHSAPAGA